MIPKLIYLVLITLLSSDLYSLLFIHLNFTGTSDEPCSKLNSLCFPLLNHPFEFWMTITDTPPLEPADRNRELVIILDISFFPFPVQSTPQSFPFHLSDISRIFLIFSSLLLLHRSKLFSHWDYSNSILDSFFPVSPCLIYALDGYF